MTTELAIIVGILVVLVGVALSEEQYLIGAFLMIINYYLITQAA